MMLQLNRSYVEEMLGVAAFVREHHDALVADFQREYNLDLDAEIDNGISAMRMRALVLGLNPNGALRRELDENWTWNVQEQLLALIARLIDRFKIHYLQAHVDKGQEHLLPKPIDVGPEEKRKSTSMSDFAAMVRGHKMEGFI